MDKSTLQFFELLRAGLWARPANPELFTDQEVDWSEIFRISREQAVIAVVFDGIESLPKEYHPPKTIFLKWYGYVTKIENSNKLANSVAAELFPIYEKKGFNPIMLKGQGMAYYYPNPLHRQSGDIDIFVWEENFDRANQLLASMGGKIETRHASETHSAIIYRGVIIENHRKVLTQFAPKSKRYFYKMISDNLIHNTAKVNIDGIMIPVPPLDFNVVYIFMHALKHFLNSGIGLRHFCDWSRLLESSKDSVNKEKIRRMLGGVKSLKAAKAFAYVAVKYLDLPESSLPFELGDSEGLGEKLFEDMMITGNFGKFEKRVKPRPKTFWRGKWHTFIRIIKRDREFYKFAPHEALWRTPSHIKYNLKLFAKKITGRLD